MITSTGGLIPLLVNLLIAGLVVCGIYWFLDMIVLPAPIKTIAKVIIGIVALVWVLKAFGFAV